MSDAPPAQRKKSSQVRKRTKLAGMNCTPAERDALDECAQRAGMTVSAYMRHQCLGTVGPRAMRRPIAEREKLSQLLGLLGKAGGNLNQVARALNMGETPPFDIPATIAEIRAAALAISATLRGKEP